MASKKKAATVRLGRKFKTGEDFTREEYQEVFVRLVEAKDKQDMLIKNIGDCEFSNRRNNWLCAYESVCFLTGLEGITAVYATSAFFRNPNEKECGRLPLELLLLANLVIGIYRDGVRNMPVEFTLNYPHSDQIIRKKLKSKLFGKFAKKLS